MYILLITRQYLFSFYKPSGSLLSPLVFSKGLSTNRHVTANFVNPRVASLNLNLKFTFKLNIEHSRRYFLLHLSGQLYQLG